MTGATVVVQDEKNHCLRGMKRLLLSLSREWNPACDECGIRNESVSTELYTIVTKKNGYTFKRKRWGRICQLCRDHFRFGPDPVLKFGGMDLARGPDLSVGYVYAPYIPQDLFGPGERKQP